MDADLCVCIAGNEPRVLYMLVKHSTTKLHLQPFFKSWFNAHWQITYPF
jgi:hypothetical protein